MVNASKEKVQLFVKKVLEGKLPIGLDTEGNLPGSISVRPSLKVLFSYGVSSNGPSRAGF